MKSGGYGGGGGRSAPYSSGGSDSKHVIMHTFSFQLIMQPFS